MKDPFELEELRRFLDASLVDVVAGPMRIDEAGREIARQVYIKEPEVICLLLEREGKQYRGTIYLTQEDFEKKVRV